MILRAEITIMMGTKHSCSRYLALKHGMGSSGRLLLVGTKVLKCYYANPQQERKAGKGGGWGVGEDLVALKVCLYKKTPIFAEEQKRVSEFSVSISFTTSAHI